ALLHIQTEAAESASDSGSGMYFAGTQGDFNAKPLSEMSVGLNARVVAAIIFVSLLLVAVSSAAGISRITKFEPMRILSERN
ncbi:MAG: hypothetical protein FWE82_08670, partial [Defluviitaleaceae bacterium]|nr:hypothetical protein [Defluviitaleaceae bacterium]